MPSTAAPQLDLDTYFLLLLMLHYTLSQNAPPVINNQPSGGSLEKRAGSTLELSCTHPMMPIKWILPNNSVSALGCILPSLQASFMEVTSYAISSTQSFLPSTELVGSGIGSPVCVGRRDNVQSYISGYIGRTLRYYANTAIVATRRAEY